jgi:hypothetical protein
MPIHKSDKFEKLLASFSTTRPDLGDSWRQFVAVPNKRVNEDGKLIELPSISFWYREESDLGLDRVLQKIVEGLKDAGHEANIELAATMAAVFAHTNGTAASAVDRLNQIFLRVTTCDLNQFVLVRILDLPGYRFKVGPFSIGPFQPDRLACQSQKAGSNYFVRYEHQLRQMPFSIEREFRPVKVVFWHRLVGNKELWTPRTASSPDALMRAVDHYFAQVSALHFKRFFEELREVQEIPRALGSGWFDFQQVRDLLGSHEISVYLNIGGGDIGFVAPSSTLEGTVNLGGGHLGVPHTEEFLRMRFQFTGPTGCEIHQSLRTYCHFLALGVEHQDLGREAEGFLHHVIALDLLLGDKGASTESISTRCAALTHRALKKDYPNVVKNVKEIYNARSKYVHEGRTPEPRLSDLVETICREVAFCLFRLQREERNRESGFEERWLKDIDYLVAAIKANRPLAAEDLQRAGVWNERDVRYEDFISELKSPVATQAKRDAS